MGDPTKSLADYRIRCALLDAEKKEKLPIVAVVTGIEEQELREIMNSEHSIEEITRVVLLTHLSD